MALGSAVSVSVSSALLINADCLSGNFGISANISIRTAPFLLSAKYSTARCCISTSMELSYLPEQSSISFSSTAIMAPKRPSPLDEPPAASSEEEVTSSGEEEEDEEVSKGGSSSSEEEEEEENETLNLTQKPKKSAPLPSTPATEKKASQKKAEPSAINSQAQSSSSEGSESDSDTESERNVKPIASKPMEETPKVKKPRSKPSASATPARSSLKRPSETTKDAKRAKKSTEAEAEADDAAVVEDDSKKSVDESKKLFQRLWSEEDEIAILSGMIDYTAKKGADPLDMNAFHDFIKKSLHVDVSKSQLMDKIRRLKKKYKNNADRGKKGADPTFSKPHEQKGFELSKKIWGGGGVSGTPVTEQPKANANGTPKKNQRGISRTLASLRAESLSSPDVAGEEDKLKVDNNESPAVCLNGFVAFDKALGAAGLPESFLKPGLDLIGNSKRTELEEEWKKLHLAELELFVRRTELVRDQAKLILDAYKSSDK